MWSTDSTEIFVQEEPNQTPVANAGSDQVYTVPHDGDLTTDTVLVTLNGQASADADGDRLDYAWSCKVGTGSVYATSTDRITVLPLKGPTATATASFNNFCTLKVTDTYGATHSDTVKIRVNREPNKSPVVDVGSSQTYTVPHDGDPYTDTVTVTLPGIATTDTEDYMSPDGKVKMVTKDDVLTYLWSCPTANVISTDATTVVSMVNGTHKCTLTVTDTYGKGYTGQASKDVTITVHPEPNKAPVVSVGGPQTYTVPHDGDPYTDTVTVTLPGSATTDTEDYMSPDGKVKMVTKDDVLTYLWECPTGGSGGTPIVSTDATTVVPMVAGTHTCKLTVTDTYGNGWKYITVTGQASKTVIITIKNEPNNAPVANAGQDQTYTVPHDGRTFTNTVLVTLVGSLTTDVENYMSPDGKLVWERKSDRLDYQWSCPTGGVTSSDVVTVVPMLAGVHICTLTVTDTYGKAYMFTGQHNDTTTITVNAEPNMGF